MTSCKIPTEMNESMYLLFFHNGDFPAIAMLGFREGTVFLGGGFLNIFYVQPYLGK